MLAEGRPYLGALLGSREFHSIYLSPGEGIPVGE